MKEINVKVNAREYYEKKTSTRSRNTSAKHPVRHSRALDTSEIKATTHTHTATVEHE